MRLQKVTRYVAERGDMAVLQKKAVEWWTPPDEIARACRAMGCEHPDLDPASCAGANERVKAVRFFDREIDGLKQEWLASTIWMNPPYAGLQVQFISKLLQDGSSSISSRPVIILNSNASETAWMRPLYQFPLCIRFGRPKFFNPDEPGKSPTHGAFYFYLGPNVERFAEVYSEIGQVYRPPLIAHGNL